MIHMNQRQAAQPSSPSFIVGSLDDARSRVMACFTHSLAACLFLLVSCGTPGVDEASSAAALQQQAWEVEARNKVKMLDVYTAELKDAKRQVARLILGNRLAAESQPSAASVLVEVDQYLAAVDKLDADLEAKRREWAEDENLKVGRDLSATIAEWARKVSDIEARRQALLGKLKGVIGIGGGK